MIWTEKIINSASVLLFDPLEIFSVTLYTKVQFESISNKQAMNCFTTFINLGLC